jgi:hypothetical protein
MPLKDDFGHAPVVWVVWEELFLFSTSPASKPEPATICNRLKKLVGAKGVKVS